jgi:hypothetical protein
LPGHEQLKTFTQGGFIAEHHDDFIVHWVEVNQSLYAIEKKANHQADGCIPKRLHQAGPLI